MSCNCTTNTTCGCQPCNCTSSAGTCNCPIKDLSTDCSIYTGDDLPNSGVVSDTPLTDVIKRLDTFIIEVRDFILSTITQLTTLVNVGTGAAIFKQVNGLGNKELRTIVSEDPALMDIVENNETIGIRPGTPSLLLDSTTDILSLVMTTLAGATTTSNIDLSEYNLDTFVQGASFDTGTEVLTITRNSSQPDINVDLSYLDNNLESVSFNSTTNNIEFTLTNSTILTLNTGSFLNPTTLPISSDLQQGIIEIATQAEVNAGIDSEKAVTPSTLSTNVTDIISNPLNLPNSTETQRGVAEIATQAEVDAGTDSEKIVTPSTLNSYVNNAVSSLESDVIKKGTVLVGNVGSTGSATVTGDFSSASKTQTDLSTVVSVVFTTPTTDANYIPIIVLQVPSVSGNQTFNALSFISKTTTGFTFKISERQAESQTITAYIKIEKF